MSSQKAPPPPNYTPIANAMQASAEQSNALAKEQFAWAKNAYAENKVQTDAVNAANMETQRINNANAAADRARYQSIYQPLEDSLATDAATYANPAKRELEMGRAQAAVAQSMDAQRKNAVRDLEGYGVNPGATRFAALDMGTRVAQGAAEAAASNQAGQQVDATGRALRSEAINVGRGYPGQIAGMYGTALNGGNSAVNNSLATTGSGANTMGTAPQYTGLQNQALQGWGNMLNTGYQNQMAQYNANQNSSSGLGTALGLGASLLFAKDGGVIPEFEDGGMWIGNPSGLKDTLMSGSSAIPQAGNGNFMDRLSPELMAKLPPNILAWLRSMNFGSMQGQNPHATNTQEMLGRFGINVTSGDFHPNNVTTPAALPSSGSQAQAALPTMAAPSAPATNNSAIPSQNVDYTPKAAQSATPSGAGVASASPAWGGMPDWGNMRAGGQSGTNLLFAKDGGVIAHPHHVEQGNADLLHPSTLDSFTIHDGKHHVLIPGHAPDGRKMSVHEARNVYARTGTHMGKFASLPASGEHAVMVHATQKQTFGRELAKYAEGGMVPDELSPSRGKNVDDVPARVNVGEFIVPKSTVEWFGQKHMYGLIEKAQKDKAEMQQKTGAVPQMGAAPAQRQALPQG